MPNTLADLRTAPFTHDAATALMPLSAQEEHIWLRQQQDPDQVLADLACFHLSGAIDPSRLIAALHATLATLPELRMRYRFDDDGELHKSAAQDSPPLTIARVDTQAGVLDHLLRAQTRHWDLEHMAPVRVLVLLGPEAVTLGILRHQILGTAASVAAILHATAQAYAAMPSVEAAPPPSPLETTAGQPALAWLRQSGVQVTDAQRPSLLPATWHGLLTQTQSVRINGTAIAQTLGADRTPLALLAFGALHFGRHLSRMSGNAMIALDIAQDSTAHPIRLTVAGDGTANEAQLRTLRDRLATEGAQEPTAEPCGVTVAMLDNPGANLRLDGVTVTAMPVPSAAPGLDLLLGLRWHGTDAVQLELRSGPAVSGALAGYLLESFAASLPGAANHQPAMPANPQPASLQPAIPQPEIPQPDDGADIVQIILAAFRTALASPDMAPQDDFFDHGGHSLIATRVIGRLRSDHGIEVRFSDLFSHTTAEALARHATRIATVADPLPIVQRISPTAPLSLAQQSLWKAYSAFGYGAMFNIPFALRFLSPVDERIFERAFRDLIERHPALRSLFIARDGGVIQQVVALADLDTYKWFWTTAESASVTRHDEAGHPFDLGAELPLRLRFVTEGDSGEQILSLLFHHIVLDEWSVNLMMDELTTAYHARANGMVPQWHSDPRPFHEFATRQHKAGPDATHLAYWTDRLRGAPAPQALFGPAPDHAADDAATDASAAGGWVEFALDPGVAEGLYARAKDNAASLFNVAYAAIAAALHQLGRLEELIIGTSAAGRHDPAFFDTIGYFTTVVAHRLHFAGDTTLAGLIRQVRDTINDSLPCTDIPIDLVEEALAQEAGAQGAVASRDHMFEVFIQIHAKNKMNGAFTLPDGRSIALRQVDPDKQESILGLQFEVMEETIGTERSLRVLISYRADHYSPAQVERIRATTRAVFLLFADPANARLPLIRLGDHPALI